MVEEGVKLAPFTDEEVRILKLWQTNDYLHPYTCCDGEPMEVYTEGLKCTICGRVQQWIHDFSVRESAATYNPFDLDIVKYKKLKDKEDGNEKESS